MINRNNEDQQNIIQKQREYMNYIEDHVNNVKLAYQKLFKGKEFHVEGISDDILKSNIECLEGVLEMHDASKYSDEEFEPYRRKWYPTDMEKNCSEEQQQLATECADEAWKHHYQNNDHHPKYWKSIELVGSEIYTVPVLKEDALVMSLRAILHMICDWEAMSMHFKGNTIDWYVHKADEEKKDMHPDTKKKVEAIMRVVFNAEIPEE